MIKRCSLPVLLLMLTASLYGQSPRPAAEQRAAKRFEALRKTPPQLFAFLKQMPKGGDLHNHLTGAIYAESFVQWSASKSLCVNQTTFVLSQPPCDSSSGQVPVSSALTNTVLYRQLIDAWSMRNRQFSGVSGNYDFFDSFSRFGPATAGQLGPMLAEVSSRAARGNVSYLELMYTPDGGVSRRIGTETGWDGNPESTLNKLKSNGIATAFAAGVKSIKDGEAERDRILKCGTPDADPGCSVVVRYISQVPRAEFLGHVFAQMVTGFELASDPQSKVVGINLLQPEDSLPSLQNFKVHMEMLSFLKSRYPKAHIALHAGELARGLVPPEELSYHIRDSVMKGHAERIGHGVSIMYEDKPFDLLRELARRNVMIEICLSSNDGILDIRGAQHPLATYMQFGVPTALATDDEGVSRSEMTREYQKAAEEQGLNYLQLKTMARTSLQHAFIHGASLWSNLTRSIPVSACSRELRSGNQTSLACKQFLEGSEKATLQWNLEVAFRKFESQF